MDVRAADPIRLRVRVEGVVQGVGFRPFVFALADNAGLAGFVGNDAQGVFGEVEGPSEAVRAFLDALESQAPPLARVERVTSTAITTTGSSGFVIASSDPAGSRHALVAADTATCDDCLAEMRDPGDRRFGYPFVNCTNCGPRYTIVRDVPYDRPATTMAPFAMCAACRREYDDPRDRRFHAQPVCCPDCGPRLRLVDGEGVESAGDPVAETVRRLRAGQVVAVKGLGGYHLAVDAVGSVDAGGATAVARLRARKRREDRPFAVMVADLVAARRLCHVDADEEALLTAAARPIVLLRPRDTAALAPAVAPDQDRWGVMLPYTPVHHLLLTAYDGPLVLTSGNLSDEPIAYADGDAARRLAGIADAFLTHDRAIHIRVDDSVLRSVRGRPMPIRRSRGYVPAPITLPWAFPRHVLACGPELKNTVCLARDARAFVSHHIGDLDNVETLTSFTEAIEHLGRAFDVAPQVVAHDLHPEYLSTKHAMESDAVELVGVQHHHAHIAACLADNQVAGPVLGVAFDGLGMGTDGTLWGGEFLVADLVGFQRVGHLAAVPMPGAARAIREPWRMAAAHLRAAYDGHPPAALSVARRQGERWEQMLAVAAAGVNAPATSSVGRLFDAVAALLDVRDVVGYEGQAAIGLERLADPGEPGHYPVSVSAGPVLTVSGGDLVRSVVDDVTSGVPKPVIAGRFHNSLAEVVAEVCRRLREMHGLDVVALSGGVFQNVLLLTRCLDRLAAGGFTVLTHSRVPPNDGGISLGQAVIAGARDRAGI